MVGQYRYPDDAANQRDLSVIRPLAARGLTIIQVAEHTGIRIGRVRYLYRQGGIKSEVRGRPRGSINFERDRSLIESLLAQGLTKPQVAERSGLSAYRVNNVMTRAGLRSLNPSGRPRLRTFDIEDTDEL